MMLLLSTSLAMAQFGDLEEIIKKAESEKSGEQMPDKPNTPDKPNNYSPSMSLSLFDNAIKDGFYLIKQEYRLEDVNVPGSRYNREGLDYFGVKMSFVLKMKNGNLTTLDILKPWDYDENFNDYRGGQYVPHLSRTSFAKVGGQGWKVEDNFYEPKNELDEEKDIVYEKVSESQAGFSASKAIGQKEVYVVWIACEGGTSGLLEAKSLRFVTKKLEMDFQKKQKKYDIPADSKPADAVCAIVVEPIYSVGQIELAVVGVVNAFDEIEMDEGYQCILLKHVLGDSEAVSSDTSLSPSEGDVPSKKGGKSSKK